MAHTVVALVLGLGGALVLYPALISELTRRRLGQRVQAFNPASHAVKAGTPTMGGLLFVALTVAAWLLLDRSRPGFVLVFAAAAGAAIGCLDDLDNVRGRGSLGLQVNQKLALQAVAGVLVGLGLLAIHATHQFIPLVGVRDLGYLVVPLAALAVVACTNAVNLTDGVDGLAASCTAIALAALLAVAFRMHAVPVEVACAVGVGSLVGFLAFNWNPARIFMGDTGSLALGALLVAACSELKMLWLLPLLGLVYVVEAASVIVNVTAITRFHRRIFRASPLHHHFEALGLREQRLVLSFAVVAAICAAATLALTRGLV